MRTDWDALPDTVTTFMTSLAAREVDRVLATLTADAVVTDEGHNHTGHQDIGAWVATAASEYTYTAELTGATATDTAVDLTQHLEGDFPGSVADLHYRFTLEGAKISRVVIEP